MDRNERLQESKVKQPNPLSLRSACKLEAASMKDYQKVQRDTASAAGAPRSAHKQSQ